MIQYPFTPYAFIAVTALLFCLPALAYLLWLRPKITATYHLIAFLLCIIANFVVMYLFHARFWWNLPLWPAQDACVVVGGYFLARFAYTFPKRERTRESRWVSSLYGLYALFTLGWFAYLSWQFTLDPLSPVAPDSYWLLMPLTILFNVAIFLRRMVYFGRQSDGNEEAAQRSFWSILRQPPNQTARAHLMFAIAVLTGIIQALAALNFTLLTLELYRYVPSDSVIAIGTLLTLSLIMMAYLNATAHQNTLIVRLVGAPLIVMLVIAGIVGIQVLDTSEQADQTTLVNAGWHLADALENGDVVDPEAARQLEGLLYVATFPANAPSDSQITFVHQVSDADAFDQAQLTASIQNNPTSSELANLIGASTAFVGRRPVLSPPYRTYMVGYVQYHSGDQIIEVGYAEDDRNTNSHLVTSRLVGQTIIGALLILLVLPAFYRRTLLVPLNRLLYGVHQINSGDLRTQVAVTVEDEFGFLTHSFNEMAASLYDLNEGLEKKVRDRTHELNLEIAEREKTQIALAQAKEQAEEANHAKSRFLSQMSHELRTPLNAILGYSQVRTEKGADDHAQSLAVIERSGRHLLRLIDDMLDLARIESGKIVLQPRPIRLQIFLAEVIDLSRSAAQAKQLTLRLSNSANPDAVALIDPTRLRQILLNLISNAIKFTESGGVTLRLQQMEEAQTFGRFEFSVSDTGSGIPNDQLETIFEPHYQLPTSGQTQGVGLGLAISAELVALMGGTLTVTSELGNGSTFSFTLNLPIESHVAPAVPLSSDKFGRLQMRVMPKIAVIDDNTDNRNVIVRLLEPFGFEVMPYADAANALEVLSEQPPDLIIIDLVMPTMDGFQFIEAARNRPKLADVPIIAASASVFPEDSQHSLRRGASRFLPKPIDLTQLLHLLDELLPLVWEAEQPSVVAQRWPSAETIADIYQAAQVGDAGKLRDITRLLAQNPHLEHFVTRLHAFMVNYDMNDLMSWLASQPALVGEVTYD